MNKTHVLKAGCEAIRVLVADSNQTQSHLLITALRRQREFRVSSCPADLAECFKSLASAPVDIVLIANDAQDDPLQVEVLRGLHNAHPKPGLILLGTGTIAVRWYVPCGWEPVDCSVA